MSADQLATHALDLFALLGPGVAARRMFGGLGFYVGGFFFGIGDPDEGLIFLKVDDQTRQPFLDAGGRPFTFEYPDGRRVAMDGYLTPPDAAMEDAEAMLPWARLGLEAARRAAVAKAAKAAKASRRKTGARAKAAPRPMDGKRPSPAKARSRPSGAARSAPRRAAGRRRG